LRGGSTMSDSQFISIWNQALELCKNDVTVPTYNTFFKDANFVAAIGDTFIIQVYNDIVKSALENNYQTLIKKRIEELHGREVNLQFVISKEAPLNDNKENFSSDFTQNQDLNITKPIVNQSMITNQGNNFYKYSLNPKYTFDSFVVGSSNTFAYAACEAVSKNIINNPNGERIYNPLFIYGGPGLGKTHLMHATAHAVLEHNPNSKIIYTSCEHFMNEFIDSIRTGNMSKFRDTFRSCDILLIDDIQFLKNKEGTQEEFFHTFNALHEANKQIIISSDRQPRELTTLEERLRTRFAWGLTTDIQTPDYETRIAILRKKAQSENFYIPDEVTAYIAENVRSNIRELEGALLRLKAYANFNKSAIDINLAKDCLQNIIPLNMPTIITGELIQEKVAQAYGIKVEDMSAKKKSRNVAYPRQIAMYLCRELTDMSLPKIGELFGGRDHTTVIHAYEKISSDLQNDASLQIALNDLKKQIKGN